MVAQIIKGKERGKIPQMKAFQIVEPGKTALVDVPKPEPKAGEVLLKIAVVGYCGSDLKTFRGLNPLVRYPRIPGHELSGVIETVGPGVPGEFKPGQAMLVAPYTDCGKCSACRQGRFNCCRTNQTLGVQRDGGLTEYLAVPAEKLHTSPVLSLREMALVEPLTVGFHAAARGRVTEKDTVAVIGVGAIGVGVVAAAASRGARVIAIDVDQKKLILARQAGAKETVNAKAENLHEALQKLTNGDGPEVIIEAVGQPQTFRAAADEACFAGRVVYIGYAQAPVEYETKYFVQKEIDLLGSRNATADDFRAVIRLLEKKTFPVDEVITRTVPLAEAGTILKQWSEAPATFTKIMIDLRS